MFDQLIGSNNLQQLMKNTENQSNIGQGISNHFYTQQIIDAKMMLIQDLIMPVTKDDTSDRSVSVPKIEPLPPMSVFKLRKLINP